jgi:hypothetical protein
MIRAGDIDGDSNLDVLLTCVGVTDQVRAYLGDGTGNAFPTMVATAMPSDPVDAELADLNGDGNLDYMVSIPNNDTISIYLGDGTGAFTLDSSLTTSDYALWARFVDMNGDGNLDILASGQNADGVNLFYGAGDGTFPGARADGVTGDKPGNFATGDFDGDGYPDLAINIETDGNIEVFMNPR